MNINLWKEIRGEWAILRNGDELLLKTNQVMQQLIDNVLEDFKNDSFDELMDWLDESTTKELEMYRKDFKYDDRLSRCLEIVLSKR